MEKKEVIAAASIVGSLTLLSRALGLVRDVLMAGFFGTSLWMSAFVVAWTIPNLFRRLFGEGALSSAFVPVFVKSRQIDGDQNAWGMAKKVSTMLGVLLISIVLIGLIAIALAMRYLPLSHKATETLLLLRIMLPYVIFICLTALAMAALNSFQHFTVPAATPSILNLTWIAVVLLVCPHLSGSLSSQIRAVSIGIIAGGILQLAIQFPALKRCGYKPGLQFAWKDPRVIAMLKLMGPAALGLAITQINVVIDRLLAAWIGAWAPAALFFSERLIYFPLGIFATALSTVLLPTFSGHAARGDQTNIKNTISHSLGLLLFIMTPAAIGLFILAEPIIQMIFEWKEFTPSSTWQTAIALRFYAPGLIVFSLSKIFVPAFYGMQDMRTPVRLGLYTVILNLVLNVIFVVTWPYNFKHAGLALATVISQACYSIALAIVLHRRLGSPGWIKICRSLVRALIAALAMAICLFFLNPLLTHYLGGFNLLPKMIQVLATSLSIGTGILIFLFTAWLIKSPELKDIYNSLVNKN